MQIRKTTFEPGRGFSVERTQSIQPYSMQTYHYHDNYEMYYLLEGERNYFINDQTYRVRPGDLVLIRPNIIHATLSANNRGYMRILVNFQEDFLSDFPPALCLLDSFAGDRHIVHLPEEEQKFVRVLLERMLTLYGLDATARRGEQQLMLAQLLSQVNVCAMQSQDTQSGDNFAGNSLVSQCIGYINHHFQEPLTLETLARQHYISTCYLSRQFKQVAGVSFVDYVNNVRVKAAMELLVQPNAQITQVMGQVGYNSNTHFDRVFKKVTGLTPLAYKKKHRSKG